MRTKLYTLILLVSVMSAVPCGIRSQNVKTYDPVIQTIVDAVNGDTLWNNISYLEGLQRYSLDSVAIQSSTFLKNYFIGLGFDTVYFQSYLNGFIPNVIAVKNGSTYPDSVILVGAHYDVYASGAPGADDNGSGTAAVMETGRVIIGHNYKRTIKLVCFSGEEEGLYGSDAYATEAFDTGEKIKAAVTMDMIAYLKPGDSINSDVYFNTASIGLKNTYASIASLYVSDFSVADATFPTGVGTDVQSFWNKGYEAIFACEGQFDWLPQNDHCSPYLHTPNDIINVSANSKPQAAKITQSVVATVVALAELAQQVSVHNNFPVEDKYYLNISPNPVSTDAIVKYYIPKTGSVRLTICNMLGQTVKIPDNAVKAEGVLALPVVDLLNGIYQIRIDAGNYCITRKFIITK